MDAGGQREKRMLEEPAETIQCVSCMNRSPQECWQLVSQWVWNLRLGLGHQLHPDPVRTTEFAPALPPQNEQASTRPSAAALASGYAPPATATSWKTGRFIGSDKKPRQVSVLLHPLAVGNAPLLWQDWSRRVHRRACMQVLRHQRITVEVEPPSSARLVVTPAPLSRAERAHARLSWADRLARNARPDHGGRVTISLFGVPEGFATSLGRAPA
jgi:hypothetical protein